MRLRSMRSRALLLLASFVLSVLSAGCVDDPSGRLSEETSGADLFGEGVLSVPPRVSVPQYALGQSWTYRVSGAWVDAPYTGTVGVVRITPTHYVLGMDHSGEIALDVVQESLFAGGATREALAFRSGGMWQDLIGLGQGEGSAWAARFEGQPLVMTKETVRDVDVFGVPQDGVRATGTGASGHHLEVAYAASVAGITSFTFRQGDLVLLQYRLESVGMRDPASLYTFRLEPPVEVRASGVSLVRTATFTSDGTADLLILQGAAEAARAGRGTVWRPDVQPALTVTAQLDEGDRGVVAVPDQAGTWRLVATSLGGGIALRVQAVHLEPGGAPQLDAKVAPMPDRGGDGLVTGLLDLVPLGRS